MPRWLLAALLAGSIIVPARSQGATTTLTFQFNSPPSTSITCTNNGPFSVPVAVGTVLSTCTVLPATWLGTIALSPSTANIGTSGLQIVVGPSAYTTPGSVGPITVTASP